MALYRQRREAGSRLAASPGGASPAALEPAIADLGRAIALDPKNVDAYFNRGVMYFERAALEAALADFDKVLELDPGNFEARRFRELVQKRKS